MKKFNVLMWDFNKDDIRHYDVLPYFRESLKNNKKLYKIENPDDLKNFVEKESRWMFWSRCEWEMICHGWPVRENDYKIDVHEQIMMNIDIIVDILWNEMNNEITDILWDEIKKKQL